VESPVLQMEGPEYRYLLYSPKGPQLTPDFYKASLAATLCPSVGS
jgi:hypothetical protein